VGDEALAVLTNTAAFLRKCDQAADGLVLFNRFYQSDIDLDELEVRRTGAEHAGRMRLPLRWIALPAGR